MKHFHDNMQRSEFIDWLRYSAIAGGMPAQFIDRVDDLEACAGLEAEIENVGKELAQAEDDRDDLYSELQDLIKAVEDCELETIPNSVEAALKWAKKALERHAHD